MSSVIEDLVKRLNTNPTKKHADNKYKKTDAKLVDKYVKYCKSCKRCWEIDVQATRNQKNLHSENIIISHYIDFPSYGKKKEICKQCKERS
tara:strand:+ start:1150 stop:1422 length:273 start_codon:yes stop_codon:yes gene_type:complete